MSNSPDFFCAFFFLESVGLTNMVNTYGVPLGHLVKLTVLLYVFNFNKTMLFYQTTIIPIIKSFGRNLGNIQCVNNTRYHSILLILFVKASLQAAPLVCSNRPPTRRGCCILIDFLGDCPLHPGCQFLLFMV